MAFSPSTTAGLEVMMAVAPSGVFGWGSEGGREGGSWISSSSIGASLHVATVTGILATKWA